MTKIYSIQFAKNEPDNAFDHWQFFVNGINKHDAIRKCFNHVKNFTWVGSGKPFFIRLF
jgi:hypothetical protein